MDGHLPPTAFYIFLALAVTVTGRLTDRDVREAEFLQKRPWLLGLLHVPVMMAWLHVAIFLACQLVAPTVPWDGPDYIHLAVHASVFGFVGIVCACTYAAHRVMWREPLSGVARHYTPCQGRHDR